MAKKKFDVHVFAVVRVKVPYVEADNQKEAIRAAKDSVNWYEQFGGMGLDGVEFGEEFSHYLVDEVGDECFEASRFYADKQHQDSYQFKEVYEE